MYIRLLVCSPVVLGGLLVVLSVFDLGLIQRRTIDPRLMLFIEMAIVLVGLSLCAAVLCAGVFWLLKQRWVMAGQAIISALLFWLCFFIGGALGGVYFNAT